MPPKTITPALLETTYENISGKLTDLFSSGVLCDTVQIDVCDGKYVKGMTWPYTIGRGIAIEPEKEPHFAALLNESAGLPFWEDVNYEIDLMTSRPDRDIELWVRAGASRVIIHSHALNILPENERQDALAIIEKERSMITLGVAVGSHEAIDTPHVAELLQMADFIQCMGIERVGAQGQGFDVRVFEQIQQIKSQYPEKPLSVDGGVHFENADALFEAGADTLVIGSAIFQSEDPRGTLRDFMEIAAEVSAGASDDGSNHVEE